MKNNLMNYVYALFTSIESNKDKQKIFLENIEIIDEILSLNETKQFVKKNFFNKKVIKKFFDDICNTLKISNYVIYWLWVIIDNNDLDCFKKIYQASKAYYFSINDVVNIDIFSSFILTKKDIDLIDSFFKKLIKAKVILNIHHDQNLLCGIKIKFLNKTYDNTIKAKLNILKDKLLSLNNECN